MSNNDNGRYVLAHKNVGDIRGNFFVPGYQRGYRWTRHDVTRLLDDVWDSRGKEYSLQPIVVKLHRQTVDLSEQEWELIDGQQRLTTLYLILRYMQKEANQGIGAPYQLRYQTREKSGNYIDSLDEASHEDNIDNFHMFEAYSAIDAWFKHGGDKFQRNNIAGQLHSMLFNSVRVIWYEAPAHVDAIPLFTRLNVGRIPLTDAELVKAELLSSVRKQSTERAHEIAAQWDGMERDLHNEDIWAFVSGLGKTNADERYPTRISLLLETMADEAGKPEGKRPRYHTFDTLQPIIQSDYQGFWKRVVALHAQILGWYQLPAIYNKIGFLVACGQSFGDLASAARLKRKSEFDNYLIDQIRNRLKVQASDLGELSYEDRNNKLVELLLLMNAETSSRASTRMPFAKHLEEHWSLEHIHAQNADLLNKADQWKTWLYTHRPALDAIANGDDPVEIEGIRKGIDGALIEIDSGKSGAFSSEKFSALSITVLKVLNRDTAPDHSIQNLALLSSAHNSRLNSSVFEVKRQMILELDREGAYVPACTRNVFLKYYADADAQQAHFWGERDKISYFNAIRKILQPYLL